LQLGAGHGGAGIQLSRTLPYDLADAPTPEGTAYYGIFILEPVGNIAVMMDIHGLTDRGLLGTLYAGTTADGSLKNAASVSFSVSKCCVKVDAEHSARYEDGEEMLLTRVLAFATPVKPFEAPPGIPSAAPAQVAKPEPYSVSASLSIMSVRIGRLPETGELFGLESMSGTGRYDSLREVTLYQDVDKDKKASYQGKGEVQSAQGGTLIGSGNTWKIHSISPSGRMVQLIPMQTRVLSDEEGTALEERALALEKQIACPLCPPGATGTLDQVDTPFAQQLKLNIREKLQEGASEEEILQHFSELYGESILLPVSPP
ncbi:MAG: cytochrome c-type biogenesis protein CcmH, partial [bacterium]|nr:cytochrome c-type biogenesis protein CcmH [bacterium]